MALWRSMLFSAAQAGQMDPWPDYEMFNMQVKMKIYCSSRSGQNSKNSIVCIVPNWNLTHYFHTVVNHQKTIKFFWSEWPQSMKNGSVRQYIGKKLNKTSDFVWISIEFTETEAHNVCWGHFYENNFTFCLPWFRKYCIIGCRCEFYVSTMHCNLYTTNVGHIWISIWRINKTSLNTPWNVFYLSTDFIIYLERACLIDHQSQLWI